ncbi:hypothetical protein [Prescottella agglutinans]|uniref:Uncharacterized protein n=1 Tax=Prescottella agglutinans TaxID=1644129 RepID=A0ABT6MJU0_9NOCA|nr:hypothetical protein [Prescottella agglutinans]MDH6284584.1 hypothetical protein [Prescottella agglutinans]
MDHTENGSAAPSAVTHPTDIAERPVAMGVADSELDAAFAAYNDVDDVVDADDDVLFAYDPEVLFDPETGETRMAVALPVSDDTVQAVHIPLEPGSMAALVSGLAEARAVQRRAEAIAAGLDPDAVVLAPQAEQDEPRMSMQHLRDTVAGKRMVDPAGLGYIREDNFPDEILGIPRQKFFVIVLCSIAVVSVLIALLL